MGVGIGISGGLISGEINVASFQIAYDLTFLAPGPTGATWAAMPAAQTELFGLSANQVLMKTIDNGNRFPNLILIDVGNTKMAVCVLTPGAPGSTLKAQIFGNLAAWEDCSLPVPIDVAGVQLSQPPPGLFSFPGDVTPGGFYLVRIVGNGGDGVTSPVFGTISLAISGQFVTLTG